MIEGRVRQLVRALGAARLAQVTAIKTRRRWQTVATNLLVKTRIEDLEQLLAAFPEYRDWLLFGEASSPGQETPNLPSEECNPVAN